MRNEILEYFRKANGNYVSGEQISRDLNVSRTAIWKHINILKSRGYIFESSTRKGYRLIYAPNLLTPLKLPVFSIRKRLERKWFILNRHRPQMKKPKDCKGRCGRGDDRRGRGTNDRPRTPYKAFLFSFCERDLVFCHFPSHVFPDGGIKEHAPCSSRRLPRYPPSRTC